MNEAAMGDPVAVQAYNEFHAFAEDARLANNNASSCGAGLTVDFHGHAHPEEMLEIGYGISKGQLQQLDAGLDLLAGTSSIKNLESTSGATLSSLIRVSGTGPNASFGGLFELATTTNSSGYLSIPSPNVSSPVGAQKYFQAGFNLDDDGSEDGGTVDAIQIEFPIYLRYKDYNAQKDLEKNHGLTGGVCP